MGKSHIRDWNRTVDEVEEAVRGCMAALDRYEARFQELLVDPPPRPAPDSPPGPTADASGWAELLDRAGQEARTVEELLSEQEAAWSRWLEAFSTWRESVKQTSGRAVLEQS